MNECHCHSVIVLILMASTVGLHY